MHLKRQSVSRNWPVQRKSSVYVMRPKSNLEETMPILVVLRDLLNIGKTKKEIKRMIYGENIELNLKKVKNEKMPVSLFDTISLPKIKKSYRMTLSLNGKFKLEEISETEAAKKISKVINKKMLSGKRVQTNFSDGRNVISMEKCRTNDSAVFNFKTKKIEKIIPMKEKANAMVFAGKHMGESGVIESINKDKKIAELKVGDKKASVLIKQIIVTE